MFFIFLWVLLVTHHLKQSPDVVLRNFIPAGVPVTRSAVYLRCDVFKRKHTYVEVMYWLMGQNVGT